jgi:hypothetical protein
MSVAISVATTDGHRGSWSHDPTRRSVAVAVGRRLMPYLIEATVVPTALYYAVFMLFGSSGWAIIAAASWTYMSVVRRLLMRRTISGLLMLATAGISVRIVLYLFNDSTFVYFAQPIARTVAMSLMFAVSAVAGRPLVARFANDFCAFDADVGCRPAIVSLFRRLTFLWAGAQAIIAGVNLTLLLTVPVAVFVGTAAATAWVVMSLGVIITVSDAVTTTRRDGLRTAVAGGGRLHAFVGA